MLDDVNSLILSIMMSFTPSVDDAMDLDIGQIRCMSDNIYFEGRNETMVGQIAIALVVMNRIESDRYPNTICDVVKQGPYYKSNPDLPVRWRCQFTWWCDGRSDNIPIKYTRGKRKGQIRETIHDVYSDIVKNAILVSSGNMIDFTEGATHYYAHNLVTPHWSNDGRMITTTIIDNHTFMKMRGHT